MWEDVEEDEDPERAVWIGQLGIGTRTRRAVRGGDGVHGKAGRGQLREERGFRHESIGQICRSSRQGYGLESSDFDMESCIRLYKAEGEGDWEVRAPKDILLSNSVL